jgi:hypothetical protein
MAVGTSAPDQNEEGFGATFHFSSSQSCNDSEGIDSEQSWYGIDRAMAVPLPMVYDLYAVQTGKTVEGST